MPLPLQKLFTYRLPSEFFELAMPGKRVFVPFGNKKIYTGIIVNITTTKPEKYEALNIISFLDDVPLIWQKTPFSWRIGNGLPIITCVVWVMSWLPRCLRD